MKTLKNEAIWLLFFCICLTCIWSCGFKTSLNEQDDEQFSVKGTDGKEYDSYQQACRAEDFNAAHEFVDVLRDKYNKSLGETVGSHSFAGIEDLKIVENKYFSALEYVYNQEIMALYSSGDFQSANRIVYLLNEFPMEGTVPQEGLIDYYEALDEYSHGQMRVAYTRSVDCFNRLCNKVLDLAISQGDEEFANKILKLYKMNVKTTPGDHGLKVNGVVVDGSHGYVQFLNTDRELAEKKIEEAKKSGAFQ